MQLRGLTVRNRVALAPMSQYCAEDGHPTSWHLTHYAERAQTLGVVIVEATAITPNARVTPHDLGLWTAKHATTLAQIATAIRAVGGVPGIQLCHGGRKASRTRPWPTEERPDAPLLPTQGGWPIVAPSAIPFAQGYGTPVELTKGQIQQIVRDFAAAANLTCHAGFDLLELHAGHGRLLHSFLSPISNLRSDEYGGGFDNRVRFLIEVVEAVRRVWPRDLPLAVRLSCVDWIDGGWTLGDSVQLAGLLREHGVDLIDCTSGGITRPIQVPAEPGYQVPFAAEIRRRVGIATAAVGRIVRILDAERIVGSESADLVLFGRRALLDPFFVLRDTGPNHTDTGCMIPHQYLRGVASLLPWAENGEHIPEL